LESSKKSSHLLKTIVKIVVSATALYLVYRKININEMILVLRSANWLWLLLAFLLYNASQLVSAMRLQLFFEAIQVRFSYQYNVLLYYLGMFYNLFLPGGIGGDGYKVYLLNSIYNKSVKSLISSLLHDRVNGLIGLLALMALLLIIRIPTGYDLYGAFIVAGILVGAIVYFLLIRAVFKIYRGIVIRTTLMSIIIQSIQLLAAWCLFLSLGLSSNYLIYLQLFLISSIVSVIPITIGGIGAREMVFVYGSSIFGINENLAVAFSLLFFLTTAASALIGVVVDAEKIKTNLPSSIPAS
jgi:uncharacterized membrane protein YbhN (UPF0104 family)